MQGPYSAMQLFAVIVSVLALLASVYTLMLLRRASRRVAYLEEALVALSKRVKTLEGVIGKAVEAIESIEEAKALKRRRRRRYIAALIVYEGRLPEDPREVLKSINTALERLAGTIGVAEARPAVMYYDPVRGALVIRTNHLSVNLVLASLLFVKRIGSAKVNIIPLRTAGTIRSARRALGVLDKLPSRAG